MINFWFICVHLGERSMEIFVNTLFSPVWAVFVSYSVTGLIKRGVRTTCQVSG